MKKLAIKGKLVEEAQFGTSAAGCDWASFELQVKEKLYFCSAFEGVAVKIREVKPGQEVECYAYFKTKDDEETKNVVVTKLQVQGGTLTRLEQCVRDYGSIEATREELKLISERYEALGYVRTTEERGGKLVHRWEAKELCIQRPDGSWYPKIEYTMDILGAKYVKDAMWDVCKESFSKLIVPPPRDRSKSQLTQALPFPAKDIKTLIDLLYQDALEHEQ